VSSLIAVDEAGGRRQRRRTIPRKLAARTRLRPTQTLPIPTRSGLAVGPPMVGCGPSVVVHGDRCARSEIRASLRRDALRSEPFVSVNQGLRVRPVAITPRPPQSAEQGSVQRTASQKHGSRCEEPYGVRCMRLSDTTHSLKASEQDRRGSKLPSTQEAGPLWPRADT
jgi:hypothetical protein